MAGGAVIDAMLAGARHGGSRVVVGGESAVQGGEGDVDVELGVAGVFVSVIEGIGGEGEGGPADDAHGVAGEGGHGVVRRAPFIDGSEHGGPAVRRVFPGAAEDVVEDALVGGEGVGEAGEKAYLGSAVDGAVGVAVTVVGAGGADDEVGGCFGGGVGFFDRAGAPPGDDGLFDQAELFAIGDRGVGGGIGGVGCGGRDGGGRGGGSVVASAGEQGEEQRGCDEGEQSADAEGIECHGEHLPSLVSLVAAGGVASGRWILPAPGATDGAEITMLESGKPRHPVG